REAFWSRAPENDISVLVRERAERLIERAHHGDINDVERRAIECDPERRALRANMDCLGDGFALGHRLVQKRLGSSSRMTASSAPLGGKVSSKSAATRRVPPGLPRMSSPTPPGCTEARYASPSLQKRSTPSVVMTAA